MGMYMNETVVMCVTPHIQGRPEDYGTEKVQVTVAMNGQDFNEMSSDAYVAFVGTGSGKGLLWALILSLLLALLLLGTCFLCWARFVKPPTGKDKPMSYVESDARDLIRDAKGDSLPRSSVEGYNLGGRASSRRN